MNRFCIVSAFATAVLSLMAAPLATAAEKDAKKISVADGRFEMTPPAKWKVVQPANNIVEHEFAIPAADGDERDGRMTIMGAGGSVEANIERWYAQFSTADGGRVKPEKAKVIDVDGAKGHIVDITGTYNDMPGGPFGRGGAVKREDYRMIGAIIETKNAGKYFLKFYGPKDTVAANEKAFMEMVKSFKPAS